MIPEKKSFFLIALLFLCAHAYAVRFPTGVIVGLNGQNVEGAELLEKNGALFVAYTDPSSGAKKETRIEGELEERLKTYLHPDVVSQDPYAGKAGPPFFEKKIWMDRNDELFSYAHLLYVEIEKGKVEHIGAHFVSAQNRQAKKDGEFYDIAKDLGILAPADWRPVPILSEGKRRIGWIQPVPFSQHELSYQDNGRTISLPLSSTVTRELPRYDSGDSKMQLYLQGDPTNGGNLEMDNGRGYRHSAFPGAPGPEQAVLLKLFEKQRPQQSAAPRLPLRPVDCRYQIIADEKVPAL